MNNIIHRLLCFVRKDLEGLLPCTCDELISHTNAHARNRGATLKDVERFRNGSVHEFYGIIESWPNYRLSSYYSSHEITELHEIYMSSNYENTTNYDA